MEESLLNVTCNWRHCTLEYRIRGLDGSQEMSRQAMFKRYLIAAEEVVDWKPVYELLGNLAREKDAPNFTNYQARYDEKTANILLKVKKNMEISLKEAGVITKVLQNQYMLQLLMENYLTCLEKAKPSLKSDRTVNNEEEIGLLEMSAIFTEMMLTDRDCTALKTICEILTEWRNA